MRRRPARPILVVVKKTTVVMGLRLDVEGRSPTGEIRSRGDSIPFGGWLGLFAAIDRVLRHTAAEQPATVPPHSGKESDR
jgi:hypothetical protein